MQMQGMKIFSFACISFAFSACEPGETQTQTACICVALKSYGQKDGATIASI